MFSIMFKSGDLGGGGGGGGGVDDIFVVCIQICSGGPCPMCWGTLKNFQCTMRKNQEIKQFPEFLLHFVLLLLLSFVVARFFETMSTFYQ